MPRASDGTYSLPAGNPVTTLSVISSTWANTTLSDISTALTGSLDRSGQGAMLAGLKLFDGVIGAPGLAWGTDTTSGLYRNGAADFRFSVSAVDLLQLGTNLFQVSGTAPVHRWNESDAAANNRLWDVIASGEQMAFRVLTDALVATNWLTIDRTSGVVDNITLIASVFSLTSSFVANTSVALDIASALPRIRWTETDGAANNQRWLMGPQAEQFVASIATDNEGTITDWLRVDRTGTTVDTVNFPNGVLQYGGNEVGYRNLLRNDQNGNYTFLTGDRGYIMIYGGAGGHTYTLPVNLALGIFTAVNFGSGNLTLSASTPANLAWANGSGSISTGNRTLAVAGVATLYCPSSGNWYVWGTGLS